jgi:hypothetical protein
MNTTFALGSKLRELRPGDERDRADVIKNYMRTRRADRRVRSP